MERLFREHSGVPPVSYGMDVRLDRARGVRSGPILAGGKSIADKFE
jgi:hypothetical protein